MTHYQYKRYATIFLTRYQRWHPREYTDVPVRIIDIDETSLIKLGQWPWPRTRISKLIEKLNSAHVATIGFDIIFSEPDRTSPQAMADLWSLEVPLRNALKTLSDHDEILANSLNKSDAVLGVHCRAWSYRQQSK